MNIIIPDVSQSTNRTEPAQDPELPSRYVVLIGFSNYNPPQPYHRGNEVSFLVTFVVNFQIIIPYQVLALHLTFTIQISYFIRIRTLDEENTSANCTRITHLYR